MMKLMKKMLLLAGAGVVMAALIGCSSAAFAGNNDASLLTIYGYNYTDHYIDQFEVNGASGSNLDVSTPGDGGGKETCCVAWRPGTHLPKKIHIRWAADACEYTTGQSMYGNRFDVVHHIFKETDVELNGPVPQDPSYFEVHFYPDGHVEVAITKDFSRPRLQLDPHRQIPMRRCLEGEVNESK